MRIFKTRTLATAACNSGKVKIAGSRIKPSHHVKLGDIIQVTRGVVKGQYLVVKEAEKRMSAKLVEEFMEDLTPEEELMKAKVAFSQRVSTRGKGQGRPSKKERRQMDKQRRELNG